MQTIIISVLSWIASFLTTTFDTFNGNITDSFELAVEVTSFVFEIFDTINFIIPVNVIFFCIFFMLQFYIVSAVLWLQLWVFRRVMDIIP